MILGLITLKHSLGLLILSFETINPGLHYVPEKSILIERGYLDWRVFFLENFFFPNQQGCCLFSSANKKILINLSLIRDEFWIIKCIIGQSKKKEKKRWKRMKMEKKNDSRVKTRKGRLEQKRENFWSLMGEATEKRKATIGQHSNPLWGPLPFPKLKIWTPHSRMPSLKFSSLSRWVLTPVKLPYSRTKNKESFQNAWFSKNSFFFKKALEMFHLLCSTKLWK